MSLGSLSQVNRLIAICGLIAGLIGFFPNSALAGGDLFELDASSVTTSFHGLGYADRSTDANVITLSQPGTDLILTDPVGVDTIPTRCARISSTVVSCPLAGSDFLSFRTGPGNDVVRANLAYPSLTQQQIDSPRVAVFMNATLGPGNDRFIPGDGTDSVWGNAGNDRLLGGSSSDFLEGGPGSDDLSGGPGADILLGDSGRGLLRSGGGTKNAMDGGSDRDRCIAHTKKDFAIKCEVGRF